MNTDIKKETNQSHSHERIQIFVASQRYTIKNTSQTVSSNHWIAAVYMLYLK